MKKNIYSKPEIHVVKIKVANNILLGSKMDVYDTEVEKGLSRRARFSDWDFEEEE